MPTVAASLKEMKRNLISNAIGGSLSRITKRDNKMTTSTAGQQVMKYCQILRKIYSKENKILVSVRITNLEDK